MMSEIYSKISRWSNFPKVRGSKQIIHFKSGYFYWMVNKNWPILTRSKSHSLIYDFPTMYRMLLNHDILLNSFYMQQFTWNSTPESIYLSQNSLVSDRIWQVLKTRIYTHYCFIGIYHEKTLFVCIMYFNCIGTLMGYICMYIGNLKFLVELIQPHLFRTIILIKSKRYNPRLSLAVSLRETA